ncbi:MAG: CvpA family protein [Candidatus Omnitrophica bacterium]|nr:CvpA family protein [Candidatus Omnitrophota bacterium]MBU1894477.1 CvpA family protein [Candidatus Omnitrophota bacterium]
MPEILNEINWLDILFIILLLGMVYKGLRSGVIGQIPSLIGGFVLLYISIEYYSFTSEAIFGFMFQKWTKPASFFIISAGIFVAVKILERVLSVINANEFALIERLGGAVIGGFRACMLFGVLGMIFLLMPIKTMQTSVVDGSKICNTLITMDFKIYVWMSEIIRPSEKNKKDIKTLQKEFRNAEMM